MKYEKWEDVPEWLQQAIQEGCNVCDAPINEYMWVKCQGKDYVVDEKSYTSAVYLYESRTLDDATPQEWDEAARNLQGSYSSTVNGTVQPNRFSMSLDASIKPKEVKVGDKWFVKIPNHDCLSKVEITLVTNCVIGTKYISYPYQTENYWVRKEVEFVEEIK